MTIEGILSIQAGDNPRVVAEKLKTFLAARPSASADERPGDAAAPAPPRPRRPSGMARGTVRGRGDSGGAEHERRALAAHLRGHDHAADGAVHGAVLDLVGEHLEGAWRCRAP